MANISKHFQHKFLNLFGKAPIPNDITYPLLDIVTFILYLYDPINLATGENTFEYQPQAIGILERLKHCIDVVDAKKAVDTELSYWFGKGWQQHRVSTNGFTLTTLTNKIWKSWMDCQ